MSSEVERENLHKIAEQIFEEVSSKTSVELGEVFSAQLKKIDNDANRKSVELLVWSWLKENSSPKKVSRGKTPHSQTKLYCTCIAIVLAALFVIGLAQGTMSLNRGTPSTSSAELREVRKASGRSLVIFVHGVRDDGVKTWTNEVTGAQWPKLMMSDNVFDGVDIMTYHYSSQLFGGHNLSISNVADRLGIRLNLELQNGYDSVVFVAHSMGGIVVRNLLLKQRKLAEKVPLVYFLSTPTAGSDVAKIADALGIKSQQLSAMRSFEQSNFLEDQNSSWRAWHEKKTYSLCAYETRKTKGMKVVDAASAQSLCDGDVLPAEQNHSNIAKPASKSSLVYKFFAEKFSQLE